jgi:hypothetical protein
LNEQPDAILGAVKNQEHELTSLLKSTATQHGWDDHIVSNLTAKVVGDQIHAIYPEHLRDSVFKLEYGHEANPPRPAFRDFNVKSESLIDQALGEGFINELMRVMS